MRATRCIICGKILYKSEGPMGPVCESRLITRHKMHKCLDIFEEGKSHEPTNKFVGMSMMEDIASHD